MTLACQIAGGIILAVFALWALPIALAIAGMFLDAILELFRWGDQR